MFNILKRIYTYIDIKQRIIFQYEEDFRNKEYLKSGKIFENKSNISRVRNISTKIISRIKDILRIKETFSMGIKRKKRISFRNEKYFKTRFDLVSIS